MEVSCSDLVVRLKGNTDIDMILLRLVCGWFVIHVHIICSLLWNMTGATLDWPILARYTDR